MVEQIFVDTNVFLRFFVRDVESFYQKARELFERAENGLVKLETNDLVIAEIIWVLESYYAFTRKEVNDVIITILESKGIKVDNHTKVEEAIALYISEKIDFIDAYNIVYTKAKDYKKIATFDKKHFKKVEGVTLLW